MSSKNYYDDMSLIALRGMTLFPSVVINIDVGREVSLNAVKNAFDNCEGTAFFVSQKNITVEEISFDNLNLMGCIGKVREIDELPDGGTRVLVEGIARGAMRSIALKEEGNYYTASVRLIPADNLSTKTCDVELEANLRELISKLNEYNHSTKRFPQDYFEDEESIDDIEAFVDATAAAVMNNPDERQRILELVDVIERIKYFLAFLEHEIALSDLQEMIRMEAGMRSNDNQREYMLREMLNVLKDKLGDGEMGVVDKYNAKLEAVKEYMSDALVERISHEIEKLDRTPTASPDYGVLENYLDWVFSMPWGVYTVDNTDLRRSARILDSEHCGLEKVKERILEYIAVHSLTGGSKGPIICLVGPPGVGKTSIARSVADALGRKFVRMSLGGVKDEAEIRGHRRTYVGAMPGRVISLIKQAGSMNPVFLFDEIDKMASDFRGDPASAMLEVLDKQQNDTFSDHFLEFPFDLSKVLFLTTANSADSIPPALYDRMEVIDISGYTDAEKLDIAQKHLYPNQLNENGLTKKQVSISKAALIDIIELYTREAGVRNLERDIGTVCRKAAKKLLEARGTDEEIEKISVTPKNLKDFLGVPRYRRDDMDKSDKVGMVTGLAWTSVGGVTLPVEVAVLPGTGKLVLTGSLGDVMKESAQNALTCVRARADRFGIPDDTFQKKDIHVNFPEGAVPKDGPSAGVTMTTAILSALTDIPVSGKVAMTGEITLRGRVLPIGGLKEKSLAAYKSGISKVLIPEDNFKDIEEIPETMRSKFDFVCCKTIDDVFREALVQPKVSGVQPNA